MNRVLCFMLVANCLTAGASAQSPNVSGIVIDDRTETTDQRRVGLRRKPVERRRDRREWTIQHDGPARPADDHRIGDRVCAAEHRHRRRGGAARHDDSTVRRRGRLHRARDVSGSLRGESDSVAWRHVAPRPRARKPARRSPRRSAARDQALPSATATDDFYSEFAVRGNPFRYVGLVVDGVPTRYLMHAVNGITDGGSIAMINSETLGSVSLLPGSYPQRTGRQYGRRGRSRPPARAAATSSTDAPA